MPVYTLQQGESRKVELVVLSDDNQSPVDLTLATKVHVLLYVGVEKVAQYSDLGESGYGICEKDATVTNKVNVFLERSQTQLYPVGPLSAIVLVEFDDPDFIEGKTDEYKVIVGTVRIGVGKDDVI